MSSDKNIPNPFGRKGGIQHQAEVKEVASDIKERGFLAVLEKFLRLFNGKGKFMDVVAIEEDSNQIVEIHQIGKRNQDGRPVKRERDTIEEVTKGYGIEPKFHSYNKKDYEL